VDIERNAMPRQIRFSEALGAVCRKPDDLTFATPWR
jgi:hypothetical protein